MKIGVKVLKTLFPEREQERMEMRGCIARATAEAEDLVKSLEMTFNGHLKEVSWEKFSASHSQSSASQPILKKSEKRAVKL